MKEFIKKNILIILGTILLFTLLILLIVNKSISPLEKIKLEEVSNDTTNYFFEVDNVDNTEIDKYINYAFSYNLNENDKKSISIDDIYNIINSKFKIDFKKEDIASIGITPSMALKGLMFNNDTSEFYINDSKKSYAEIASTKIYKYNIKKIKKISNKKYLIIYDKYVIENPYEVLNYYNELSNDEKNKDKYLDIANKISSYLKGESTLKSIIPYINKDVIKKCGKREKTVKITYVIDKNSLLIKEFK